MSRSPSKGVGITEITERAVMPVPATVSVAQAVPQTLTSTPSIGGATAAEDLAPSTSQMNRKKISDLNSVPSQYAPARTPPVSPSRPLDLSAYKNEDLSSILGMMNSKIAVLLSAFETQRHVTRETKGTHKVNEPVPPSFASVAKKGNKNSEWTKVAPKRLWKKPEAIIIKKTGEASYTDMLRKLKADPCQSQLGSHVKKIRRTQQGELLLEVEGKAAASMSEYRGAIEESLREMAAVRTGARRMALTCSGMDEATTAMQLYSCMASQFEGIQLNSEDVRWLCKMRDGTQVATVTLSVIDAIGVLNKGSVNVGWSRCRIIQDTRPIRCYKCLGYGHRALNCKEPDRSNCCLRCGEQGHKAKGCVNPPNCLICNSDTDRNHPTAAQSLLSQTAIERNADVMLLSEPYVPGVENAEALFDSTRKAAVICCRNLYIEDQESVPMRGIAYAKVKGVHLYSCYAPPSDSPDLFEDFLDNLIHHAGDFNAWEIEWGSRTSNPRGRAVIDAMNQLDLVLLNDGGKPTFNNDRGTSFIDVTFVNRSLPSTANWMVQEDVTLSDHALITFSARSSCITQRHARSTLGQAWDIRKLDKDMLAFSIEQMEQTTGHAESMVASLMKMLEAACDAAMPRKKKNGKRKPPVYWWNGSLNHLRSECFRARRQAQRARGLP
ncbi:uncharacterized protein LOC122319483 [Drosophila yakuba]|uniref:uncharacterized protein LOC122319483 n=1 Tax=Drosophila yakuba TaxID=7245 RepID=UPI001C8A5871|nr:uncharacterized protein LOC122319483 [Drosophila yakuba]